MSALSLTGSTATRAESVAEKFCADAVRRYMEIVERARAAAVTTSTPHWKSAYSENMQRHRRVVGELCKRVGEYAKLILDTELSEENEKSIKDQVKAMGEERESHQAWRHRAIEPISCLAENAALQINDLLQTAEQAAKAEPLFNSHTMPEINKIVEELPKVIWHDDTGVLEVEASA